MDRNLATTAQAANTLQFANVACANNNLAGRLGIFNRFGVNYGCAMLAANDPVQNDCKEIRKKMGFYHKLEVLQKACARGAKAVNLNLF
jgi:hypothetical protein